MMEEIIRKSGFKITKPRKLVLDILRNNEHPVSAHRIYDLSNNRIDLASVYRTLSMLESLNIVFKERFGNEERFYMADKQHHHIICRKCGLVECIPCRHLFEGIRGFDNVSHNLSITGICKQCI